MKNGNQIYLRLILFWWQSVVKIYRITLSTFRSHQKQSSVAYFEYESCCFDRWKRSKKTRRNCEFPFFSFPIKSGNYVNRFSERWCVDCGLPTTRELVEAGLMKELFWCRKSVDHEAPTNRYIRWLKANILADSGTVIGYRLRIYPVYVPLKAILYLKALWDPMSF